jgi:hypothetical protein
VNKGLIRKTEKKLNHQSYSTIINLNHLLSLFGQPVGNQFHIDPTELQVRTVQAQSDDGQKHCQAVVFELHTGGIYFIDPISRLL